MTQTLEHDLERLADDTPSTDPDDPTIEMHATSKKQQDDARRDTPEPVGTDADHHHPRKPSRAYTPVPYQTYAKTARTLLALTAAISFSALTSIAGAPQYWQAALTMLILAAALAAYATVIIPRREHANMIHAIENAYGIRILAAIPHDANRLDLTCTIPHDRHIYEATLFHMDGQAWLCTGTTGTIVGRIA